MIKAKLKFILVIFICSAFFNSLIGQEYVMSNDLVDDCMGTLTDSEMGPEAGQYDHNEDYTFTICVEDALEIIAQFDFFATEDYYDVLTVYDGPDVNSPVIAVLDGVISNPPVLVATSGCMTFHFVSDDNIVANGWVLNWMVELEEITEPDLNLTAEVECPLGSVILVIDPPVDCSNFVASNFQLIGPGSDVISGVNLLDCDNNTNLGSTFELFFSDSLSLAGLYRVLFTGIIVSSCGDTLDFESEVFFDLADCPFEIEAYVVQQACIGDCGELYVEIYDTDPGPFEVTWSHTAINSQSVEICADSAIVISVSVLNTNTNESASAEVYYEPYEIPVFNNPFSGDTLCSSFGTHLFNMSIPDGVFNSQIMDNWTWPGYQTWRWRNSNGIQMDVILYTSPQGCEVRDTVYIIPVNAGLDQAVCIGADSVILTGANPNDGIWSGIGTTDDGIFVPPYSDTFYIEYTSPEGCVDVKRVFVTDSIVFLDIDTICSTIEIDLRWYVNSFGGNWTGPGIVNNYVGRLRPWLANLNAWNRYYYTIEGCMDSLDIYVQDLYAGPDQTVCISTDVIQLPASGNWSGPGVYSDIDSSYDISALGVGDYNITRSGFGCSDVFILYIRAISVDANIDLRFCPEDEFYQVENIFNYDPGNGIFSGSGISDTLVTFAFNPEEAGIGTSVVYFEALGCIDSIEVFVEAQAIIEDYSFCEIGGIKVLESSMIGTWNGPGIIDSEDGLFDPEETGQGNFEVYFISELGCVTPVQVEIFPFLEASIDGYQAQYCFKDTSYEIELFPNTGTFYIDGIESSPFINPSDLGSGNHHLVYTTGEGECSDETSIFITILDPISGQISIGKDSLCPGESSTVSVSSAGGVGNWTAIWDNNLGFGTSHIVDPESTTTYTVTISDGCSDDLTISVDIFVNDSFEVSYNQGPPVCYGDSSFVEIVLDNAQEYDIYWEDDPLNTEIRIVSDPGTYFVNITENSSSCEQRYELVIPGSAPIGANFSIIPNQECVNIIDNEFQVIDLAFGYSIGFIDYGDGSSIVNLDSSDLAHEYNEIGIYTITQVVENELGCLDSFSRDICVENRVEIYIPNVFSPNGDEINDFFEINAFGIDNVNLEIYNRWGSKIFQTNSLDTGWDGTFKGKNVMSSVLTVVLSYRDQDTGEYFQQVGDLTLIR